MSKAEKENQQDGIEGISKSQRKREMTALQKLGEKLTELNSDQINLLPISHRLKEALLEAQHINKHEAKRRQMQFIGRLMAEEDDAAAIEAAWENMTAQGKQATQELHIIEQWRARLINEGKSALTEFVEMFHPDDIQHLRHLISQAHLEQESGKPAGSGRALFRYLRDVMYKQEQGSTKDF